MRILANFFCDIYDPPQPPLPIPSSHVQPPKEEQPDKMAPSNLPSVLNATTQDIEMLLAAQCHVGSKNLQVHMEPYLWKTRADGINILNIGKTWYVLCWK
jgi:small subunit ribosomal protein SAe